MKRAVLPILALLVFAPTIVAQSGGVTVTQLPVPGTTASVNTLNPDVRVDGPFAGSASSVDAMPFDGRLTLDDAIRRALAYNLGAIERSEASHQARSQVVAVRSALLPSVVGSATGARQELNLEASGIQFPALAGVNVPTVVGPFNAIDFRAHVSQTVLDLTAWNAYRAAKTEARAAALASDDARDLVVLAVGAGYLQVLTSRARVESARAQVETANALLRQTSQQRAVGVAAQLDVNRSQVELLTQQQRLLSLQNDLSKQKISLARLTGLSPNDQFEIADTVVYEPAPAIDVTAAIEQALSRRSDVQAAQAGLTAATQALVAARSERLPVVTVDGDYGAIGTTVDDARRTFGIRGAVRVPLWNGGRTAGDIGRTDALIRQRRAELENVRAEVAAEVRRARLDVEAAAGQVELSRTNLVTSRQTLDLTRQRFQSGVTDTVDLVRSQEAVAGAELDYINSVFAHNIAKLAFARAVGSAATSWPHFLKVESK